MKQLLVLSGKGGTGKTTIASALIKYLNAKNYADCDVDAPNLYLTQEYEKFDKKDYFGMKKALIDKEKCTNCGECIKKCNFNAIGNDYKVNEIFCEGCAFCEIVCKQNAIRMVDKKAGEIKKPINSEKNFVTAELKIGNGTSGKLVKQLKEELLKNKKHGIAIIDGSPGIGCSVIASIIGADFILLVAEASYLGVSDFKRILKLCLFWNIEILVCINKSNLNQKCFEEIKQICENEKLNYVGELKQDKQVLNLLNQNKTILESKGEFKVKVDLLLKNIEKKINEDEEVEKRIQNRN